MKHLALVAVHDPNVTLTLKRELAAHDCEVILASTGVDAVGELHGADFELAIIDVNLPPLGGLDVLRVARNLAPDTEIVMFGRSDLDAAMQCMRAGARDYLREPFAAGEVWSVASRAFERRALETTTALLRASHAVLVGTDPRKLPAVIVEQTAELLDCDGACLLRPDALGTLYVAHAHGFSRESDVRDLLALAAKHRYDGTHATEAAALVIPDDTEGASLSHGGDRVRSVILHPIFVLGQLGGILAGHRFGNPRRFRRTDIERAAVLASQIRLALENAALLQKTVATQRLAAVGELAANVAHEINNPVTYVLSGAMHALECVEDMAAGKTKAADASAVLEDVAECLRDVCEGADRIREISRDLRTLARGHVESEVFDLSAAVRSALRVTGTMLRGAANVVVQLSDGVRMRGSPGRLCQVFVNLLANAAQATASCERPARILVSTTLRAGEAVAVVQDTGVGIPPDLLSTIFEPFFSTKSGNTGTGLGLSISRGIVEDHGGRVEVTSVPGEGTTFTIVLPALTTSTHPRWTDTSSAQTPKRARLLFIDDDWAMLRTYERWFGRESDIVTVQDGRLALELLERDANFDAIVCDLAMPHVSGLEVFQQQVRQNPGLSRRFVFATGAPEKGDLREMASSMRDRIVEKPFAVTALRTVLQRIAFLAGEPPTLATTPERIAIARLDDVSSRPQTKLGSPPPSNRPTPRLSSAPPSTRRAPRFSSAPPSSR